MVKSLPAQPPMDRPQFGAQRTFTDAIISHCDRQLVFVDRRRCDRHPSRTWFGFDPIEKGVLDHGLDSAFPLDQKNVKQTSIFRQGNSQEEMEDNARIVTDGDYK